MTMASADAAALPTLHSRLVKLGALRDAFLFLATADYVLGYITWALYSADRALGVLPPLEGQYFFAGLVPLTLVVVAVLLVRALVPQSDPAKRARSAKYGNWFLGLGLVVFLAAQLQPAHSRLSDVATAITAGCLYVGMANLVRSGDRGTGFMVWVFRIAIPLAVLSTTVAYSTWFFPAIPLAFGGPRAECVQLDLAAGNLSVETSRRLGLQPIATPSAQQSVPLWLHFRGTDGIVVSTSNTRPVSEALYLRFEAITGMTRCDAATL